MQAWPVGRCVCGGRFSAARIMSCGMRSRCDVSAVALAGVYFPLAPGFRLAVDRVRGHRRVFTTSLCWCPSGGVSMVSGVFPRVRGSWSLPRSLLRGCRFRVSLRGDGINIGRWRCQRQAGGAKNFDRYRPVTLRRQEKTPRPARMQIRGSWITSTQQRRCGGGSRQTVPRSAWPSRWTPTRQRAPPHRCLRSRQCPA